MSTQVSVVLRRFCCITGKSYPVRTLQSYSSSDLPSRLAAELLVDKHHFKVSDLTYRMTYEGETCFDAIIIPQNKPPVKGRANLRPSTIAK